MFSKQNLEFLLISVKGIITKNIWSCNSKLSNMN